MTELELKQLLSRITRPDETARTAAHAHWASLAKPLGGLGRLETMLEDAAANPASGRVMEKAGFVYHHNTVYHKFDGTPSSASARASSRMSSIRRLR